LGDYLTADKLGKLGGKFMGFFFSTSNMGQGSSKTEHPDYKQYEFPCSD
jgi:hypothetical protein